MAVTKKRSSASATIPKTAIEQVSSKLSDLPEKPRENLSLREAISELHDSITIALNRGYSYDEVVSILASQGVEITVASLKRYLAAARKEKGVTEKPKRARRTGGRSRKALLAKQAEALSTAAAPSPSDESDESAAASVSEAEEMAKPAEEPTEELTSTRKRTRSTSTRSKTAAKSTTQSKTAAKAKPTSRAKTTSRSTSTRSRRKRGES